MLVVFGNSAALVQFSSKEEAGWHVSLCNPCKKKISNICDEVGMSGFTEIIFEDRLRQEWIPAIDLFIERWGKELVPHDLCAAIYSVWKNLDLPSVKWQAMLLLTGNGSGEEPPGADHLGRVGLVYDLNINSWNHGSAG